MIAPQSTCKSIKHQVSILPHWFIPSLLPLHLVGTSNSDRSHIHCYFVTIDGDYNKEMSTRLPMAIELTASVGYDYGEKCAVNHFETHVIVPASMHPWQQFHEVLTTTR